MAGLRNLGAGEGAAGRRAGWSSSPGGVKQALGPVVQPPTPGATLHTPEQKDFESVDI